MKVIAKVEQDVYICQVSHTEIEKYLGLYYGKLKGVIVGTEIDLSKGFQYHSEILGAMKKTTEFIEANSHIVSAIMNGLRIQASATDLNDPQK